MVSEKGLDFNIVNIVTITYNKFGILAKEGYSPVVQKLHYIKVNGIN